jgi:hypothetical protein
VRPDYRIREIELLHPELQIQYSSVRPDYRIREIELLHLELQRHYSSVSPTTG